MMVKLHFGVMLLYVSLFLFMEDKEYSEYSEEPERVTLSRLPSRLVRDKRHSLKHSFLAMTTF